MHDSSTYPIWNPETGITDLKVDPGELSASEVPGIKAVWADLRQRLEGTGELSDFIEQMSREWAIETGIIENLYQIDRGITQTLIERGFRAELLSHGSVDKPHEYVIRLLRDQKDALDGIFDFVKGNRILSVSYIKELHAALLRSQKTTEVVDSLGRRVDVTLIKGDWKTQPNFPERDGVIYAYCPPERVGDEMDRLVSMHANHVVQEIPGEVQAAWLHHRFTQIHPFQDGNGRVARAIASLVLIKDGLFPLVVTRDYRPEYLDSLEAADAGDLKPLVDLVARLQTAQFRAATAISRSFPAEGGVQAALIGLRKTIDRIISQKPVVDPPDPLEEVFSLALIIEKYLKERLEEIMEEVGAMLAEISHDYNAYVEYGENSEQEVSGLFRSQILENARLHIGYSANVSVYSSYVSLGMQWSRSARLVFAIHGIGGQFSGSLICAPFLELRDIDEEEGSRISLVPVVEEGFVFFYNENQDKLLSRFGKWCENPLQAALTELTRNL